MVEGVRPVQSSGGEPATGSRWAVGDVVGGERVTGTVAAWLSGYLETLLDRAGTVIVLSDVEDPWLCAVSLYYVSALVREDALRLEGAVRYGQSGEFSCDAGRVGGVQRVLAQV